MTARQVKTLQRNKEVNEESGHAHRSHRSKKGARFKDGLATAYKLKKEKLTLKDIE